MVNNAQRGKEMTNKQHFNLIVRKANTLNNHFNKLRQECIALIDEAYEHSDNYDCADYEYELALLVETLNKLASIDIEETIPEKHTIEY